MAIVVENSEVSAGGAFNFICPAGTDLLLMWYGRARSVVGLSWCSYDGDAMTLKEDFDSLLGNDTTCQLWYLNNPATIGDLAVTHDFVVGTSAYDELVAVAISGAFNTGDPFTAIETQTADGGGAGPADIVQSIASAAGELVVDLVHFYRAATPNIEGGMTLIQRANYFGTSYDAGAGTVENKWNLVSESVNNYAWVMASIKPPSDVGGGIVGALGHNF